MIIPAQQRKDRCGARVEELSARITRDAPGGHIYVKRSPVKTNHQIMKRQPMKNYKDFLGSVESMVAKTSGQVSAYHNSRELINTWV